MKSAAKPAHDAASKRRKPATRKARAERPTPSAARRPPAAKPGAELAARPPEDSVLSVSPGRPPREFCGSDSETLAALVFAEASEALEPGATRDRAKLERVMPSALGFLADTKPADPLEAAVIVGMKAAQVHAMQALHRSTLVAGYPDDYLRYVSAATRLLRASGELLDALSRYRGKESSQRVTVEHIHLEPGAQAFVGVAAPGGSPGPDYANDRQAQGQEAQPVRGDAEVRRPEPPRRALPEASRP